MLQLYDHGKQVLRLIGAIHPGLINFCLLPEFYDVFHTYRFNCF